MTRGTAVEEDPHAAPWLTSHNGARQTFVDRGGRECEPRTEVHKKKKDSTLHKSIEIVNM